MENYEYMATSWREDSPQIILNSQPLQPKEQYNIHRFFNDVQTAPVSGRLIPDITVNGILDDNFGLESPSFGSSDLEESITTASDYYSDGYGYETNNHTHNMSRRRSSHFSCPDVFRPLASSQQPTSSDIIDPSLLHEQKPDVEAPVACSTDLFERQVYFPMQYLDLLKDSLEDYDSTLFSPEHTPSISVSVSPVMAYSQTYSPESSSAPVYDTGDYSSSQGSGVQRQVTIHGVSSPRRKSLKRSTPSADEDDDDSHFEKRVKKAPKKSKVRFNCKPCNLNFRSGKDLREHNELHHEKENIFKCFICTKTFGARNEWKRHVTSQHIQLSYWKCDDAGCKGKSIFNRKDLFGKHVERTHVPKSLLSRGLKNRTIVQKDGRDIIADHQERCEFKKCPPPQNCRCGLCGRVYSGDDTAWETLLTHVAGHYSTRDEYSKKEWVQDPALVEYMRLHKFTGPKRGKPSNEPDAEYEIDEQCDEC